MVRTKLMTLESWGDCKWVGNLGLLECVDHASVNGIQMNRESGFEKNLDQIIEVCFNQIIELCDCWISEGMIKIYFSENWIDQNICWIVMIQWVGGSKLNLWIVRSLLGDLHFISEYNDSSMIMDLLDWKKWLLLLDPYEFVQRSSMQSKQWNWLNDWIPNWMTIT